MDEGPCLSWESFSPCHGLTFSTKDTPFKKKYPEIKHSWREPKQPLSQPSFESDISNPTLVCSHFYYFYSWKTNENEAKEQEIIPILEFYHFWRDSKFNTLSFFHIGESSRSPSPMRSFRNRNVGEGTTLLVKRSSAAGSKRKTFMCSAWLLANLFPRKFHGISTWDTPGGSRIFSHHLSLHVQ